MIRGQLAAAARQVGGTLAGDDAAFAGVSTDTRSVAAGQLFVALKGPHFDAHEFLDTAAARSAAGAVVSDPAAVALPQIEVADTLSALGALAAGWRARLAPTVLGVTGSSGKTTVKELLAAILSPVAETLVTRGNLNNEIGVPLTLFGLEAGHRYAVIEMGANHAGEIERLAAIARPDVAVVTMAGASHLEGFGDLDGVARAKGELFAALGPGGTAVVNADDTYAGLWETLCPGARRVRFGLAADADADVTARKVETVTGDVPGSRFELVLQHGVVDVELPLPGQHNVMNALAAAAAAEAAGATPAQIRSGLEAARPVAGRLALKRGPGGCRVIDDTYNANPASVRAAIDFLVALPGRPWAVLGDMGELGAGGPRLHREIGEYARDRGVERLFTIGPLSAGTAAAFGDGATHFADIPALCDVLNPALDSGVDVLVKGSRMMRLERVVEMLGADTPRAALAEEAD